MKPRLLQLRSGRGNGRNLAGSRERGGSRLTPLKKKGFQEGLQPEAIPADAYVRIMGMSRKTLIFGLLLTVVLGSASGCAKNVDRINFNKWGNSYLPKNSSMDNSAQGGASQNGEIPSSANFVVPKASVGGSYHRSTATSPRYRMVGGFHSGSGQ